MLGVGRGRERWLGLLVAYVLLGIFWTLYCWREPGRTAGGTEKFKQLDEQKQKQDVSAAL